MTQLLDDARKMHASSWAWFRIWMPYQYQYIEHGKIKHLYLPLNRNYKPLGVYSDARVEYEDYAKQGVIFSRDPHTFKGIWSSPNGLYLYTDNPETLTDYFDRFNKLLLHHITIPEF